MPTFIYFSPRRRTLNLPQKRKESNACWRISINGRTSPIKIGRELFNLWHIFDCHADDCHYCPSLSNYRYYCDDDVQDLDSYKNTRWQLRRDPPKDQRNHDYRLQRDRPHWNDRRGEEQFQEYEDKDNFILMGETAGCKTHGPPPLRAGTYRHRSPVPGGDAIRGLTQPRATVTTCNIQFNECRFPTFHHIDLSKFRRINIHTLSLITSAVLLRANLHLPPINDVYEIATGWWEAIALPREEKMQNVMNYVYFCILVYVSDEQIKGQDWEFQLSSNEDDARAGVLEDSTNSVWGPAIPPGYH